MSAEHETVQKKRQRKRKRKTNRILSAHNGILSAVTRKENGKMSSDAVLREELANAGRKISNMQEEFEHQQRELSKARANV